MAELVSLSHCGHFYIMEASRCSQRHDVFTLGLFYFFLPSLSEFAAGGRGRGREGGGAGRGGGIPTLDKEPWRILGDKNTLSLK